MFVCGGGGAGVGALVNGEGAGVGAFVNGGSCGAFVTSPMFMLLCFWFARITSYSVSTRVLG